MSNLKKLPNTVKERVKFLPTDITKSISFKMYYLDENYLNEYYNKRLKTFQKLNNNSVLEEEFALGVLEEVINEQKKENIKKYKFESQIRQNLKIFEDFLNKKINQLTNQPNKIETENQKKQLSNELNNIKETLAHKKVELSDIEQKIKKLFKFYF